MGNQNLNYLIEKYFGGSRISAVSRDVSEVVVEMKASVRRVVSNVESVKQLESRAESINHIPLVQERCRSAKKKNQMATESIQDLNNYRSIWKYIPFRKFFGQLVV